jgi:uncharacterized protein YciI
MRHFIVELSYTVSFEQLQTILPAHRVFLNAGYEMGWVLYSGPQEPKTGGMIVARAPSLDDLKTYFTEDPLQKNGLANYRFIEFNPVRQQPFMDEWCK